MGKPATTEELSDLHAHVAKTLTEDLTADISGDDPELLALRIKARHEARAQAITFLKNNNITAGKGNAELDALQQALAEKRKRAKTLDPKALEEAAALHAQMHGLQ